VWLCVGLCVGDPCAGTDALADAIPIDFTSTNSIYGHNVQATTENGEPLPSHTNTEATVWFRGTVPLSWNAAQGVNFGTENPFVDFDTVLDVFSGPSVALTMFSLVPLGGSTRCLLPPVAQMQQCVSLRGSLFAPNATVYFRVGGLYSNRGYFQLKLTRLNGTVWSVCVRVCGAVSV
jgi:hypothetical protein